MHTLLKGQDLEAASDNAVQQNGYNDKRDEVLIEKPAADKILD